MDAKKDPGRHTASGIARQPGEGLLPRRKRRRKRPRGPSRRFAAPGTAAYPFFSPVFLPSFFCGFRSGPSGFAGSAPFSRRAWAICS